MSTPINTLAELQTSHPALYAAAVAHGEQQERERVSAHLTMGAEVGDLNMAVQAVTDGSSVATMATAYIQRASCTAAQNARQADSDAAGVVVDGVVSGYSSPVGDLGDQVVDIWNARDPLEP